MGTTALLKPEKARPQRVVKAATGWPNFVAKIGDAKPRWGHPTPPSVGNVLADPPGMRHFDFLTEIEKELEGTRRKPTGWDWQCLGCLRKRLFRTSKAQKPRVCPWCNCRHVSRRKADPRKGMKQIQATKN